MQMQSRESQVVSREIKPVHAHDSRLATHASSLRLAFVVEQTLGHVTHGQNLRERLAGDATIVPEWLPVPFEADDRWQRMPFVGGNWTLRSSLRAREMVRAALRRGMLDGLFFHTQVTALFAAGLMRDIPTVVSLDATPLNVDSVGAAYNHAPSANPIVEALKNVLTRRTFRRAGHLITWCEWAKGSLVRDYGIPADKVTVVPPGVDMARWTFSRDAGRRPGPVRLLFVGGDFRRKGGEDLLKAYGRLPAGACELDIVTRDTIDTSSLNGVRVHNGLGPNTPGLLALYEAADVFVFPTLGDCLPIAVMEAMAAGLPVVATCVGAIGEEVADGVTGISIAPGDVDALAAAIWRLAADEPLRRALGEAGRLSAVEKFDGARNYRAIIDLYKRCVHGGTQ